MALADVEMAMMTDEEMEAAISGDEVQRFLAGTMRPSNLRKWSPGRQRRLQPRGLHHAHINGKDVQHVGSDCTETPIEREAVRRA